MFKIIKLLVGNGVCLDKNVIVLNKSCVSEDLLMVVDFDGCFLIKEKVFILFLK